MQYVSNGVLLDNCAQAVMVTQRLDTSKKHTQIHTDREQTVALCHQTVWWVVSLPAGGVHWTAP